MRFLKGDRIDGKRYLKIKSDRFFSKLTTRLLTVLAIVYVLTCLFIYVRDYILYRANQHISPSSPNSDFRLDYQDVWLDVPKSTASIHGWWFNAPSATQPIVATANELGNILTTSKTILYLCSRGGSKTHYNSLARIKGFEQLGFSVLAIDYRGYGLSEESLPNEIRLYEDSQAA